ncbi:MAG TPA: primosomal protein N' [Candidatus Binatia bacterium]
MPGFVHVTPLPAVASLARLTYSVPDALAGVVTVGVRVVVPLGPRRVTALVVGMADTAPDGVACRPLISLLDDCPIVPGKLLELLEWMADYYLAPVGEALALAVGRALTTTSQRVVSLHDTAATGEDPLETQILALLAKAGRPTPLARIAQAVGRRSIDRSLAAMSARGVVSIDDVMAAPRARTQFETTIVVERLPDELTESTMFSRAPKRRALFDHLVRAPGRRATMSELGELFPSAAQSLVPLVEAGLVRSIKTERLRAPGDYVEAGQAPELTNDQQRVVDSVTGCLESFSTLLLQGVTAAGKTEVYLRSIEETLSRGKGALVLVPEISLTHQVVARLRARFGDLVAVLHSDLTPGERWDEWRRIARGQARVAVGARSAVLAPLPSVGLIVVDEEHDASYKQDDGVRYHARDTAVMRGRIEGCPVLLGSATPSLESWRHAIEGRYRHLRLPNRVTPCPPPRIEVVDLRGKDIESAGGLSPALIDAIRANFDAGGQTLLFLNRRGYARSLQCWGCGSSMECSSCSVALTVHQGDRSLRCHHCDARRAIPSVCPSCGKDALFSQGLGTQRLEAAVRSLLPRARIARLDRDVTEQRGLLAETLAAWRRRDVDVLLGTQMIAKGHDVPGVTLVGVVQADMSLSIPDFRGSERTYQLIAQVAGRAGRGNDQGRVLVQTYQPEHPAIAMAAAHEFDGFARIELAARAELGYPPHTRMGMLRLEGAERSVVDRLAAQAARAMSECGRSDPAFAVRGPAPAVIERIKERYRFHVQVRSVHSTLVRAALAQGRASVAIAARASRVRVLADVDPVDMF